MVVALKRLVQQPNQKKIRKSTVIGEPEGMPKSVSSFRKFRKNTMSGMRKLLRLMMLDSSGYVKEGYVKIQKKSLLVLVNALCLLEALENEDVDNHSGSKDVSARLISVPDGGGIEEPEHRADETPITVTSPTEPKFGEPKLEPEKRRKSTVIPHGIESSVQSDNHVSSVPDADDGEKPAHGTDGLERFVQSAVMVPCLWQVIDDLPDDLPNDLPNWKGRLEEFNLPRNTSFSDQLNQITNNVRSEFPRLLQLQEGIQDLSSEDLKADLKVYCVPLCWSSRQRVEFFCHLSDRLYKPKVSGQQDNSQEDPLLKELKSKQSFIFNGQWDKEVEEWMKSINRKFWPQGSDYKSVECLLRFVRNRQHHPDTFQDSKELRNTQSFYNYFDKQFDKRFSNLLMLSYRAVYRLCREEPWFKDYLPSQII